MIQFRGSRKKTSNSRSGRVVNFRHRWKLVTQTSAHGGGGAQKSSLQKFEGFQEILWGSSGGIVLCVRDSLECHQTSSRKVSCWDLAGGPYARHYLSLLRVPQSFRIQTTPPTLTTPWIYFYISSFLHLSLPLSLILFLKVVPRDRILSVRLRTVDTYRSILFTTQSILRDVGVPISAVSALFFPLFAVPCLRIHTSPSCFMRLLRISLSTSVVFRRYADSTSLSRGITVKSSAFFFFSRRHSIYNIRMNLLFLLFSLCLNSVFYVKWCRWY